jgi:16S rRNA (cytosine1402-N4)-methyltransferase
MEIVHTSVMAKEAVEYLRPNAPGQLLIDATLGEGGHSESFLQTYPDLLVCGIDADPVIQAKARQRLAPFGERMRFWSGWYNDFFESYPLDSKPDRILFDFGISIFHYVESGRGFSFSRDESLDMRLNPNAGQSVAEYLARVSVEDLANVIFQFGEERLSRRIARGIIAYRAQAAITGSKQLADIIWHSVPADYRHGRIHPATRTFQALRIHVNRELERIDAAIRGAFQVLKPGGLMGVITFHSLEDRGVKQFFRHLAQACHCPAEQPRCTCDRQPYAELLFKKALVPSAVECENNPPSRSAKFRFVRKLKELT